MTVRTATAIIEAVVALCVAGAIAAILSAPIVDVRDTLGMWELPGGFDPLPEFETTSTELEFRGAECRLGTHARYTLVRECPSETDRQ